MIYADTPSQGSAEDPLSIDYDPNFASPEVERPKLEVIQLLDWPDLVHTTASEPISVEEQSDDERVGIY